MSTYRPSKGGETRASRGERGSGPYSRLHLPPPVKVPAPPPGPAPATEAIATLWIGSLLPSVTDDDLFDSFAPYGFVTDVNMSEKQSSAGGLSAYIKFTFRSEAEAALSASLNRQLLVKGKAVTCRWAQKDLVSLAQLKSEALKTASTASTPAVTNVAGSNYTAPKIWIGNLPMGTTEEDLRTVCRGVGGELVDIIIHKKPSQYGQLSGFLRFKTQLETEMMLRAISSGAIQVRGATLKADWAKGSNPQT
mmetsp:Transcript_143826/g.374663  ORF Transcript_143826/g.374663 Transcript_143826/m.374663 type:complete len:250 (+) Transcript_143826:65-814(+)